MKKDEIKTLLDFLSKQFVLDLKASSMHNHNGAKTFLQGLSFCSS
jgi:hypothetical protein